MTSDYDKLKKINQQLTQDNIGLMKSNNKLTQDIAGLTTTNNKLTQDQQQLQQQLETERMMRKKMALQLERDAASKIHILSGIVLTV